MAAYKKEIAERKTAEREVYDELYKGITDQDILNLLDSDSDEDQSPNPRPRPSIPAQKSSLPDTSTSSMPVQPPLPVKPTIALETKVNWTPQSIAEMSVRWSIVGTPKAVKPSPKIIVHVSTTNGQVLAARVDGKTTSGWRIMFNPSGKLILYPTNAPHSKIHWLISYKESIPDKTITWTRAGKTMKWVLLPSSTRKSVLSQLRQRAGRYAKDLGKVVSPRKRKRGKEEMTHQNGCRCGLEDGVCKELRENLKHKFPACDCRLSRLPSTNPVYGTKKRQTRAKVAAQAYAQRRCLGLPPDAPANLRFSPIHFHPDYIHNHPEGLKRKAVLLEESEAMKYGMVTRWNTVTTKYDGTPKVLAIPNYLGEIYCKTHPYKRARTSTVSSIDVRWSPSDPTDTVTETNTTISLTTPGMSP